MIDTVLAYPMHDWNEWKVAYKPNIRTGLVWDKLVGCAVGFKVADAQTKLTLVHYESGDWRDGIPIQVAQANSTGFAYLRVPGTQIADNEFLVLDGTHRLLEIRPQFVVIDYLIVPPEKRKYITDYYNAYYTDKT